MPEGSTLSLILSIVFLIFSAFFSGSEAAFLSLQRTRIAHLVSTNAPGAKMLASMMAHPERLLATILLGNNLVNISFTAIVTVLAVSVLGQGQGVAVATALSTLIVLIVGEIVPKTIALRYSERVAFLFARPLKLVEMMLWPLVVILQWITHRVSSLFKGDGYPRGAITEGEFRTLIGIGHSEGTFESAEAEMLENVFRFGDRQVREVMTPRTEIVFVPSGATLREFLDIYAQHEYTRYPVYTDETDNIAGIISAKDVLKTLATKGLNFDEPIADMIREAQFTPETKRIAALFDEMRLSGNQTAIAIDEYGGLAGLVTLKQLSEEVVGPAGEEGEGPEEEYKALDENTFQVEGSMSIEEVNEELRIKLPAGDFDTIAGFALDALGHIPVEGEQIVYGNVKLEITQMNDLRIESIKVTRMNTIEGGEAVEADTGQARRDAPE